MSKHIHRIIQIEKAAPPFARHLQKYHALLYYVSDKNKNHEADFSCIFSNWLLYSSA